jgi:hypothetical protein
VTQRGSHTPEFAFEKSPENVRRAVSGFRIGFPVAVDCNYRIWRTFDNSYWPAAYFIDAHGNIRHHQFGEGDYAKSERVIQSLLAEAGKPPVARDVVVPHAEGAQAAPDQNNIRSSETYIGYGQATNFASPGGMQQDAPRQYTVGRLRLNQWGLSGQWIIGAEQATHRFHARDLHLVLGPAADGRAVRFLVTIDGKPPGDSHGADSRRCCRRHPTGSAPRPSARSAWSRRWVSPRRRASVCSSTGPARTAWSSLARSRLPRALLLLRQADAALAG